jgi:predicted nucleotidyltransferase
MAGKQATSPMSRIEKLLATDTRARVARVRVLAARALRRLAERGVEARLIGSLARGDFLLHSDVDLLVLRCPAELRHGIEELVEETLEGLPFDVVYLDELAPARRAVLERESLRASDLR